MKKCLTAALSRRFHPTSKGGAKLIAPASDRLVGHDHAAFKEQFFDVTQAQLISVVPADGATDHAGWKTVPAIQRFRFLHRLILLVELCKELVAINVIFAPDMLLADSQDFQEGEGLPRRFVTSHVLNDRLRLATPRDEQRITGVDFNSKPAHAKRLRIDHGRRARHHFRNQTPGYGTERQTVVRMAESEP